MRKEQMFRWLMFVGLSMWVTACGQLPFGLNNNNNTNANHNTNTNHASSWSYEGETGPNRWGDLNPEYKACKSGEEQSPVDIPTSKVKSNPNLKMTFAYNSIKLKITNNGHSVEVDGKGGGSVQFDGKTYDLRQFHFHTPCEHKVDGKAYTAELHLVHQDADGKFLVVGIFFDDSTDKDNEFLSKFWSKMPTTQTTVTDDNISFNTKDVLPTTTHFYTYAGSLTTPACGEGVRWVVLQQSVSVSKSQIKSLHDIVHNNARPVQSLFSREVQSDK